MVEEAHYKRSRPVGAESPVFLSQLSWHCSKLTGGELKYRKLLCRSLRELPPPPVWVEDWAVWGSSLLLPQLGSVLELG